MCFVQEAAKFQYYPYGLTVSCIFLGITLIVYLCLPKVSVCPKSAWINFHVFIFFSYWICMEKRWSAMWLRCWQPTSFWRLYNFTRTRNWNDVTRQVGCCGSDNRFNFLNLEKITPQDFFKNQHSNHQFLPFVFQLFSFSFVFWLHFAGRRSCVSIYGSHLGKSNIVYFSAWQRVAARHTAQHLIIFRC